MKAALYERAGSARDVLVIGDIANPTPGSGEVRVRIDPSGLTPGDTKKRADRMGYGMPFPRVIPHSDGSGVIDQIGDDVHASRLGQRARAWGAQSYRAFGTAT